ncbi:glycoside hydrolase family 32 protein [Thermoanaerobacter mathranii]|uniref:glycoside hydrolase family 32 protein n=1 Tax=Thermoanaerobacter mathranii TaxID=583357 RepID=UPI003D6B925D
MKSFKKVVIVIFLIFILSLTACSGTSFTNNKGKKEITASKGEKQMSTISYADFYKDKYRPQFHFTPLKNWMNDPNGMVYYKGEYHLFYQHYPYDIKWGAMHWGHAVSKDLIHWEYLPIALWPDDNGFIFSGSAVVDWNDTSGFFKGGSGLVAIFTQAAAKQTQSIAYSTDDGRTWTMYKGNPVLVDETAKDFRDPRVFWYKPGGYWVMVLAVGDHVRFYTSSNLKEWEFASEFGKQDGSHEGVWECPDLFELPVEGTNGQSKWVLIVSIGDNPMAPEGSRTQYFIGHFDGKRFINDNPKETVLWLDYGRDNYAGVTWSDIPEKQKRRIFIGWMSNWKYAGRTPTTSWRGAMTFPRELKLFKDEDGRIYLAQQPVRELSKLRDKRLANLKKVLIGSEKATLPVASGDLLEIIAEFELGTAEEFGIKVRKSDSQETIVGYDAIQKKLFIDRSRSGDIVDETFPVKHYAPLKTRNNKIRLHILVDRSSVEIFANDGKVVMTDLIFPDIDSQNVELFSKDGTVKVTSLTIYKLRSIYEKYYSAEELLISEK